MLSYYVYFKKQLYGDIIYVYPFKVYNSVHLSIFTELCNHHHNLILEHFHHPQKEAPLVVPSAMPPAITN